LIELLVVISIIALLVSILIPALRQARDAAKTVLCSHRLSQTGLAFAMYDHDFPGYIPPCVSEYPDETFYHMWQWRLGPYMPGGRDGRTYEIVHCPTIAIEIGGSSTITYGMNALIGELDWYEPKKVIRIEHPSSVILVADSIAKDRGESSDWPHPYTGSSCILLPESYPMHVYVTYGEADYRHKGNKFVNVLYLDGHAITGDVPYSDDATEDNGVSLPWKGH